ncbi:MAG: TonB-dependent receptor [Kangiellaceae bacterium]|nr:TonB-dependent receptor [Kangiellaceae bacterium]
MNKFKPSKLTIALLSTGMLTFGVPLFAEEALAQNQTEVEVEKTDAEEEGSTVVITGIRGSLARAQAFKMENTSIIEAISAEDIGKLPDSSVAESLARLPGLAGERRNGRTSGLAVRGFNENYVASTLNGRELLGMGDNRGVEYDLYPSEIIENILVYKTPEASLFSQGIGGTIDMRTVSPLTAKKSMTLNASYEQNERKSPNPDFDNNGSRFAFNFVDQFMDNKLGIALALTTEETVRQEEQFRGWGYATVNTIPEGEEGFNPRRYDGADTVAVPDGTVVLGGHDSFVRSAELERDSVALVVEYAPTESLKIQLDALYIDFKETDVRREIEAGGAEWGTSEYTITGIENGLVTSAFYDGFHNVIRNDARTQDADLFTIGLNFEYDINENWVASFDYSTSEVDKNITDVETYSGVGRAGVDGRPLSAYSFEMTSNGAFYTAHPSIGAVDNTNSSLIRLAGPQAWGGGLGPLFPDDAAFRQDGFVNQPVFHEELDNVRFDIDGTVEMGIFSRVKAGIAFSDREKSKENDGFFLTASTFPGDGPIVDPVGTVSLDFIGLGNIIAYDPLALFNNGFYEVTDAVTVDNGRLGDTYTVKEELITFFAQLDIDTEIADIPVRGNIGVQVIDVDQSSSGFSTSSGPGGFTSAVPVSGGAKYTDVLPSFNLSFEIAEGQFIRTAAAKVLSRPRLDDMRANQQVSFQFNDANILSTDVANSPWSGSSGNPTLRPLEANQLDLSYENYFADDGYFAINLFYKDLVNWHRGGVTVADFSDSFIPGFHQTSDATAPPNQPPAIFEGGLSFREDGLEGFVRGQEVQLSLPFRLLDESLDGLGIVFSAAFLDGEFDDGGRIPGLSDENYSFTAYYEKNGFEFRVSATRRDEFLTETRGLSLALVETVDQGGEVWDAQIGYDFAESGIEYLKGLRVTLQAQNITDEPSIQANGEDSRQITQFQTYGANNRLNLNYSF